MAKDKNPHIDADGDSLCDGCGLPANIKSECLAPFEAPALESLPVGERGFRSAGEDIPPAGEFKF
jgi:hypothetical protein